MTYWWQNIFLVGNMIHTQDQIYQVSSAPLTGEKKKHMRWWTCMQCSVGGTSQTWRGSSPWQAMKLLHGYILCACSRQRHRKVTWQSTFPLIISSVFMFFWKHMLGWFSKIIIWGHHLTALILQRLRNGQRETEDVSLDAANHWRESVRHVVIYTLAGSNITRGEESLPRHDKHTFIIKVY